LSGYFLVSWLSPQAPDFPGVRPCCLIFLGLGIGVSFFFSRIPFVGVFSLCGFLFFALEFLERKRGPFSWRGWMTPFFFSLFLFELLNPAPSLRLGFFFPLSTILPVTCAGRAASSFLFYLYFLTVFFHPPGKFQILHMLFF